MSFSTSEVIFSIVLETLAESAVLSAPCVEFAELPDGAPVHAESIVAAVKAARIVLIIMLVFILLYNDVYKLVRNCDLLNYSLAVGQSLYLREIEREVLKLLLSAVNGALKRAFTLPLT